MYLTASYLDLQLQTVILFFLGTTRNLVRRARAIILITVYHRKNRPHYDQQLYDNTTQLVIATQDSSLSKYSTQLAINISNNS